MKEESFLDGTVKIFVIIDLIIIGATIMSEFWFV